MLTEHTGKMKVITPFVGSPVDICKAKSTTCKRGRPTKPKVKIQEF